MEKCFVFPAFQKGDRRDLKNYRGISIHNTCYEMYSKILNVKLQTCSKQFMTETQNGFRKGRSCTDVTFCLISLIENEGNIIWKHTYCLQIMKKHLIVYNYVFYLILKHLEYSRYIIKTNSAHIHTKQNVNKI